MSVMFFQNMDDPEMLLVLESETGKLFTARGPREKVEQALASEKVKAPTSNAA